jgi:hypothetical protein
MLPPGPGFGGLLRESPILSLEPRPGLETGRGHQLLPLPAMGTNPPAMEPVDSDVGQLVAEDFLEKVLVSLFQVGSQTDHALDGPALAQGAAEAATELHGHRIGQARKAPELGPMLGPRPEGVRNSLHRFQLPFLGRTGGRPRRDRPAEPRKGKEAHVSRTVSASGRVMSSCNR